MNEGSTINWVDCKVLTKKFGEAQIEMMSYSSSGFPKTGFSDDFMLCVKLLEVRDQINKILDERKRIHGNASRS